MKCCHNYVAVEEVYNITNMINTCKHITGPCKTQRFRIATDLVHKTENSQGNLDNLEPDQIKVHIYLSSKTVTFNTLQYKVGRNSLVSTVGGGLGLFLGVSLLTTLQSLYEYIGKKLKIKF